MKVATNTDYDNDTMVTTITGDLHYPEATKRALIDSLQDIKKYPNHCNIVVDPDNIFDADVFATNALNTFIQHIKTQNPNSQVVVTCSQETQLFLLACHLQGAEIRTPQ